MNEISTSSNSPESGRKIPMLKASDLRAILEYVPLYRNQTFVIAIDGSVIECDNFSDIITDIAVLRSLNINVVLVHGIGRQLKDAGLRTGTELSDVYGTNPVDDKTFALAHDVSAQVLQTVRDAFAAHDLNCVTTNAIRATEVGIISGIDFKNAGRTEKIDFHSINELLKLGMIPVFSPIATGRDGRIFRINSDLLAAELAAGLHATKLIYLTETSGLSVDGGKPVAIPVDKLQEMISSNRDKIDPRVFSKVNCAAKILDPAKTPRAHVLDGRRFACLLTELFDKVGCGTMIYCDEYQKIRPALPDDARTIWNISEVSSKEQNLVERTLEYIEKTIDRYFVYEVDGSIIGFVSLLDLGGGDAELASLHVQEFYRNNKVGSKLVDFVIMKAKKSGYKRLFTLSTKSAPFFKNVCHFDEVQSSTLPQKRLEKYVQSKRNSRVFLKNLQEGSEADNIQ